MKTKLGSTSLGRREITVLAGDALRLETQDDRTLRICSLHDSRSAWNQGTEGKGADRVGWHRPSVMQYGVGKFLFYRQFIASFRIINSEPPSNESHCTICERGLNWIKVNNNDIPQFDFAVYLLTINVKWYFALRLLLTYIYVCMKMNSLSNLMPHRLLPATWEMEYIIVAVVLNGWEICSLVLRGEHRVSNRGMEKITQWRIVCPLHQTLGYD
jgi:hypothetical protein